MEASISRSSVLLGFSKCETRLFIHIINLEYPISRVPEGEEKMKLHTVKKKKKKKKETATRRMALRWDCIHPSRGLSASSNSFKSHE